MTRPARGSGKLALLEAVVRVTARLGLRGVTYRTVATEAGVSYGLVTYHFGSRDAMIEEALAMTIEKGVRAFPDVDGNADFDIIGSDLFEVSQSRRQDQLFQYEVTLEATRKPELKPLVDQLYQHYRDGVANQLHSVGIDDPRVRELVFSALEGMTLYHSVSEDDDRLAEGLAVLRSVVPLLAGALPGASASTRRGRRDPDAVLS